MKRPRSNKLRKRWQYPVTASAATLLSGQGRQDDKSERVIWPREGPTWWEDPSALPRPPPPLGFMTCEPTTLTEDSMDSCHWTVHVPFRFTIRWSQCACPSFIIHTSPFLCHLCTNLYGLYSHDSRMFIIGNRENDWNLCLHSKTKRNHAIIQVFFGHQKHVMCVYVCTYMFWSGEMFSKYFGFISLLLHKSTQLTELLAP